jgi:rod shape-determining protein MreC
MAAVNERGLVGRVIEVGRRSARILLLTDFNSRVPVMVEPSRDQAVLAGDNSRAPGLVFLPINPRLSVGDRVVTSGRGGVLPPGLAVGVVSVIADGKVAVTPLVDWDRLSHLRLLEYGRVLPPEQLEELQQEIYGPPLPPDLVVRRQAPRAAAGVAR